MTRVSTLASHNSFVRRMLTTQSNFNKYNLQSTTGQKSTDYTGIGKDAFRLINMENEYNRTETYIRTNTIAQIRLEQMSVSFDAIQSTLTNFKNKIVDFSSYDLEGLTPVYYDDYVEGELQATAASSGDLTFSAENNTITVENAEFFENLVDGAYIKIANTANNDGIYKIDYVWEDKTTIKISNDTPLVDEVVDVDVTTNVSVKYAYTPETESSKIKSLDSQKRAEITALQTMAFNVMKDLEYYLNQRVDGRYLFGGGNINEPPVNIPFNTLKDFQAYYDGQKITYPTTNTANLSNVNLVSENFSFIDELSNAKLIGKLEGEGTGEITIVDDDGFGNGTITAQKAGAFDSVAVGDTITLTTASGVNDGEYTVLTNDGTTITVEGVLIAEAPITAIADLESFSITSDNPDFFEPIVGLRSDTGVLSFDDVLNTVTAATPDAFAGIEVGAKIEIKNSGTLNDGIYTVLSNDGTTIEIEETFNETIDVDTPLGLSNVTIGYNDPNADPEVDVRGDLFFERMPQIEPDWNDKGYITAEKFDAFMSSSITASPQATGNVYFSADKNTIVAQNAGTFNNYSSGDTIVVNNSVDPSNNGVYYIDRISSDGKTVFLSSETPLSTNVSFSDVDDLAGITFGKTFPVGSTVDLSGINAGVNGKYTILGVEYLKDYEHPDYDNMEFLSTAVPDPQTFYTSDSIRLIVQIEPDDPNFPMTVDPETGLALTDAQGEKILPNIVNFDANFEMSTSSYYEGDHLELEHRLNDTRSINVGVNAEYAAFEKAIRALAEIAQGNLVDERDPRDASDPDNPFLYKETDTDRAYNRVMEAMELLQDAFEHDPKSGEKAGDLATLTYQIATQITTVDNTIEDQKAFLTFLEIRVARIEEVDPLEAVTNMQAEALALQISYSVLSKAQEMTLLNYL